VSEKALWGFLAYDSLVTGTFWMAEPLSQFLCHFISLSQEKKRCLWDDTGYEKWKLKI
jgi:hypothetical protein